MKQVYSNNMVAQVWAQQNQSYGRNSNNSFYFRDATIYSYGNHFPIASHVELQQGLGPNVILFTTRTYSVTTAKHTAYVRQAIPSYREVLHVENVLASTPAEHTDNLKGIKKEFLKVGVRAVAARQRFSEYWERMETLKTEYNRYRNLFQPEAEILIISEAWKEQAQVKLDEAREARKKERQRKAEQEANKQRYLAENVKAWVHGLPLPHPEFQMYGAPIALRLKPGTRGTIETSTRAEVPMKDCQRLWGLVKVIKAGLRGPIKGAWDSKEIPVGSFFVRSIDTDGTLRAGCHTISYEAMEALAIRLGRAEDASVLGGKYVKELAKAGGSLKQKG